MIPALSLPRFLLWLLSLLLPLSCPGSDSDSGSGSGACHCSALSLSLLVPPLVPLLHKR